MLTMRRILLAIAILTSSLAAGDEDPAAWQSLRQLAAGQKIQVVKRDGESLKGAFLGFSDDAIRFQTKQQEVSLPRADVSKISRPADRGRRNIWIGAAIGGAGGLVAGGLLGARLANESGGDFANLKPAVIGGTGAAGALVGALIGSVTGKRHTTIYRVK